MTLSLNVLFVFVGRNLKPPSSHVSVDNSVVTNYYNKSVFWSSVDSWSNI